MSLSSHEDKTGAALADSEKVRKYITTSGWISLVGSYDRRTLSSVVASRTPQRVLHVSMCNEVNMVKKQRKVNSLRHRSRWREKQRKSFRLPSFLSRPKIVK